MFNSTRHKQEHFTPPTDPNGPYIWSKLSAAAKEAFISTVHCLLNTRPQDPLEEFSELRKYATQVAQNNEIPLQEAFSDASEQKRCYTQLWNLLEMGSRIQNLDDGLSICRVVTNLNESSWKQLSDEEKKTFVDTIVFVHTTEYADFITTLTDKYKLQLFKDNEPDPSAFGLFWELLEMGSKVSYKYLNLEVVKKAETEAQRHQPVEDGIPMTRRIEFAVDELIRELEKQNNASYGMK